jgi:cysteinyl-tRNA synthetase
MDDDLNTPRALAALFDLAREINRGRDAGRPVDGAQGGLRSLGGILGLTFQDRTAGNEDHRAVGPFIELLLETRSELRQAKQYEQADKIREGLERRGVVVEDTANGPVWEFRPTI